MIYLPHWLGLLLSINYACQSVTTYLLQSVNCDTANMAFQTWNDLVISSQPSVLASNTTTLSFQECLALWPSSISGLFWRTGCYILRNLFQFKSVCQIEYRPSNTPLWAITSAKSISWRKWSWCAIVHSQPLALWLTFTSLPSGPLIPSPSIISQAWFVPSVTWPSNLSLKCWAEV